ncbi:MAG TPA: WYL domain-containing protein [Streptosporangiaceae bacterium]|nr:WYL domain-containing protein [Streptosporangiaceae bacterium]
MSRQAGAAAGSRASARASTTRLQRLLALVPYVTSRKVASIAETAAAFGLSERQLVDDLNMLWCVELRSPDPYCPIDLSYEGGEIVVSQADPVARPLRLGADEASALLVALRMLADVQEHGSTVGRVIAKLEAASGEAAALSSQVAVQVEVPGPAVLSRARAALQAGRRVHLTYYVPGRDEATERDVDLMRIVVVDGRTYLEGWCRRAEGVRLFRIDRVVAIEVLSAPAEIPAGAEPKDLDQGLYQPGPDDLRVVLELAPEGRWVADYYPCDGVQEIGDGRLRVVLRTADARWVRRLALKLGDRGHLVEPAGLAAAVREQAAAALAQYGLA